MPSVDMLAVRGGESLGMQVPLEWKRRLDVDNRLLRPEELRPASWLRQE